MPARAEGRAALGRLLKGLSAPALGGPETGPVGAGAFPASGTGTGRQGRSPGRLRRERSRRKSGRALVASWARAASPRGAVRLLAASVRGLLAALWQPLPALPALGLQR